MLAYDSSDVSSASANIPGAIELASVATVTVFFVFLGFLEASLQL